MNQKDQTFSYEVKSRPELVNFDGDKILLCEKTETGKSLTNYIYQYKQAGSYVDRREAIAACAVMQDSTEAVELLKTALRDRYYELRDFAITSLDLKKEAVKQAVETFLFELAKSDPKPTVKASAITALSTYDKQIYKDIILRSVNDSSYSVAGAALNAVANFDSAAAYTEAKKLSRLTAKGKLSEAICNVFAVNGKEEDVNYVMNTYNALHFGDTKFELTQMIAYYAIQLTNTEKVKQVVDGLIAFREEVPGAYKAQLTPYINNVLLRSIANQKTAMKNLSPDAADLQRQIDYVNSKIN